MNGLRFSNFFSKSGALLIYFSMDRNLFAVLFYTWNKDNNWERPQYEGRRIC